MTEWCEFRLWYTTTPNPGDSFTFKKTHIIPILEKYNIEEFLILDEPGFILLRVEADNGITGRIRASLEEAIRPIFSQVTAQSWSPQTDAKNRILDARRRAGILDGIPEEGWMIKGKTPNGWWIPAPEDLDKQVTAFSTFMSKVLGKFTKAYLKEIPYRVEDRWLMSVFVHLILDSVSTNQTEENEIRQFPYI